MICCNGFIPVFWRQIWLWYGKYVKTMLFHQTANGCNIPLQSSGVDMPDAQSVTWRALMTKRSSKFFFIIHGWSCRIFWKLKVCSYVDRGALAEVVLMFGSINWISKGARKLAKTAIVKWRPTSVIFDICNGDSSSNFGKHVGPTEKFHFLHNRLHTVIILLYCYDAFCKKWWVL